MLEALATILTSKRSMIAVVTAVLDLLVLFGLDADPALAETLAQLITAIGGLLIVGISHSDHGKAMGQPAGVDHKGRGRSVESREETPTPRRGVKITPPTG